MLKSQAASVAMATYAEDFQKAFHDYGLLNDQENGDLVVVFEHPRKAIYVVSNYQNIPWTEAEVRRIYPDEVPTEG